MTLSTLRPTSTTSNTGALTGGATAHAVLSDNSDASFVTYDTGESSVLGLTDLTLPAGAVIATVQARTRVATAGGTSVLNIWITDPQGTQSFLTNVTSTSILTLTTSDSLVGDYFGDPWTDAGADALTTAVIHGGPAVPTIKVYEHYIDVHYVILPVVTVTSPTGTITNSNTPTIAWSSAFDSEGLWPYVYFDIKIYTAAQYGAGGFSPDTSSSTAASGIVATAAGNNFGTSWVTNTILADATYRAYIRVAQNVNGSLHWSSWAFGGFIINVTKPAVPTLAVTAESTSGRIKVDLTANAGSVTTDRMELQRSADSGATWGAVRNTDGDDGLVLSSTTRTIYDYEAPNGTTTSYRARAQHSYSGVYASSAWSATGSATWTATDWWIKHPNVPALNLKLTNAMFSYANIDHAARQGVFQPLGAALPIVVSDTRGGATGSVIVMLSTAVLQNALDTLLDQSDTLLLQGPSSDGHPDRYVRFGDHSSVRLVDRSWAKATKETLPWIEVASPTGAQT